MCMCVFVRACVFGGGIMGPGLLGTWLYCFMVVMYVKGNINSLTDRLKTWTSHRDKLAGNDRLAQLLPESEPLFRER